MSVDSTVRSAVSALDRHASALRHHAKLFGPPAQPVFYRTGGTVIIPASRFAVVKVGAPPQGHMWHLRSLSVGSLVANHFVAGLADLFVSGADLRSIPNLDLVGLADWRDRTNLPRCLPYSTGEVTARAGEGIYVAFTDGTPGHAYVAMAQVEDVEESALGQESTF